MIIQFPTDSVNVDEWIKLSTQHIAHDTPVIMAYKMPDGEVHTAYWNAKPFQKQELLGHIQMDIMMDCVKMNAEEIFEVVV